MISACQQSSLIRSRHTTGRRPGILALLIACLNLLPAYLHAGGGPENVLLVVNKDSPVSLQVANAYIKIRDIPQQHVVWLSDIPYPDSISLDTFKTRIWKPIREFITQNRLDDEIDIIAYSADFPYAVNFSSDLNTHKLPTLKYHGKEASLTGLTFFARHIESDSPYYLAGNANLYFRRNLATVHQLPRSLTDAETGAHHEAEKAFSKKDFQTAATHYEALVQGFPAHGGLWYELARSRAAPGNNNGAMAALQQAVNNGWTNSLKTTNDPYLKALSEDPAMPALLKRMETHNGPFQAAHGFSGRYEWTGATLPVKTVATDSLHSHYLATLLAWTGTNGNSVPEVKHYLSAARHSDATHPEGTVYLMVNTDVRSETRQPLFLETVAALERRGHNAVILSRVDQQQDGIIPQGKDDVIGAVVGAAKFQWQPSGSRLLPGAIAESLTSYGGRFSDHSQTKLTEFLRYGAAGASGTVHEPFSLQPKFPLPLLHAYYADGASLAEAFYQSVEAPYQLLIVGDPLARPFAHFADIELTTPDPQTPWSGVVTLHPKIIPAADRPIAHLELWVDGQLIAYAQANKTFGWDTRKMDDGYHELRLVAQEADRIETRSYTRIGVILANNHHQLAINPHQPQIRFDENISLSGTAVGGNEASLWQGNRRLASAPVNKGRWQLQTAAKLLGVGPVSLGVRASFADQSVVRSEPLTFDITPPALTAHTATIEQPTDATNEPGEASEEGHKTKIIKPDGLLRNVPNETQLAMEGDFKVERSGFYQLVVVADGTLSLAVDGRSLLANETLHKKQTHYLPLSLEQGFHRLEIEFLPARKKPDLQVILEGDQIATVPELRLVSDVAGKTDTQP
jgi:hypothetical protein